jgi:hypothetical protein
VISSARLRILSRLRGAKDRLFAQAVSNFRAVLKGADAIASNVTKDNRHAQRARHHTINEKFQSMVIEFKVSADALT